jgi:protein-tyrosine phosphatase
MSSETHVTPPPPNVPATLTELKRQEAHFSGVRWLFTGILRVAYRRWTRIAVRLFPEDSKAEQLARRLHIPLPDQLNMNWVTEHLAVGGRVHPEDIPALARAGITHVIDTRSEYCDDVEAMAKEHIQLLHLPARDTYPLTVEQLREGAKWAVEQMRKGGRVLIHCEHGVGRSVLLTCAVLVYDGMSAHDALQLAQQKRWQAAPNHRQVRRLREFEAAMLAHPEPVPDV